MANGHSGDVRFSRAPSGSATEIRLEIGRRKYFPRDIESVSRSFWWLNRYLNGRTPVQFYFDQGKKGHLLPDDDSISALKDYVRKHKQNSGLDYGNEAIFSNFDTAYFYRNFLKCLIAAHHLQTAFPDLLDAPLVIDIGCGVGTFGIACWLMHSFPQAEFVLLDQHKYQLHVARYLVDSLRAPKFSFIRNNAFREFGQPGLRVSSYWLCCNRDSVLNKGDAELAMLLRDGLVLIDYKTNIEAFIDRIAPLRPEMKRIEIEAPLPKEMRTFVGSRDITVHMLFVDRLVPSQNI